MSRLNLRKRKRICYYEPEEPPFDEYIYCTECRDYVYEYCSIHGPLLVVPDDKVPTPTGYPPVVPRAALTAPRTFLHLAKSLIPDAGIGVFATLTLPSGVRFGPYRGVRLPPGPGSCYGWQVVDANHKPTHIIDALDPATSNWMRFVNCSRHCSEQNLVAYQYQGQIYYRTVRVIPRFTELLVFYGSGFARELGVDLRRYRAAPRRPRSDQPCGCPDCQTQETENPASTSVNTKKRQTDSNEKPVAEKVAKLSPIETNLQSPKNAEQKGDANNESTIQPISSEPNVPVKKTNDEPNAVLTCDQCEGNFKSKTDLEKHVRAHALDIEKTDGALTKPITKTECDKCKISFATNAELTTHLYTHMTKVPTDKNTCKSCNAKFETNMCLIEHMECQHNVKFFSCTECDYRSIDEGCLVEHQKTHVRERMDKGVSFSCDYTSNKKRNKGDESSGEKPYKCDICDYTTAQSINLKTHVMSKHAGVKPFKCSYCSYASTNKSHLSRHARTHTGEKPYKCDICDYKAARSFSLKTHVMSKHAGVKPFKCSYCNYASTNKSNLSKHARTHTGEKPYKCDICEYKAAYSNSLKQHLMRIHAGVKP